MINLPESFVQKMQTLLKDDYQVYIDCYEQPRYYGLRVNTAKISVEDFLKISPWELKPVPWIDNGFYYDGDHISPAKHPYYYAGLYYLQEPSAMTPANRIPIEPGDKVLDVCAAPGGKATELGAKLNREGLLIANDISNSRARGLLKNLELFGIGNMMVISEEPGKLMSYFPSFFDKILIDAPCSGEGMFRKDKKMVKAWEEHGPEYFSKLQRSIITQAATMLKPGGILLYSTCTFDPLENEQTIEYLIEKFPEFHLLDMKPYEGFCTGLPAFSTTGNEELQKAVRIFPHKMAGEGHFIALLQKGETLPACEQESPQKANKKKLPEELDSFIQSLRVEIDPARLDFREERVYYMPKEAPALNGVRFLRSGLLLGELKKNRFEPSQALAMYLRKEEYPYTIDLPVCDDRVIRYLKGETLDVSDLTGRKDKGWYLVCVDGYPLGFGKLASQTLKNKYLPGWRWVS